MKNDFGKTANAGGDTVSVASSIVVAVLDPQQHRAARVETVIKNVVASIVVAGPESDWSKLMSAGSRGLALLGFNSKIVTGGYELSAIRNARSNGFSVIVYADSSGQWDVQRRCLPFIAGAAQLLDSSKEGFESELRKEVEQIVQILRNESIEEQNVRKAIAQLGIAVGSKKMVDLYRMVLRFSRLSDLPILVSGETGTGKEQVARALHQLDPKRSKGPFLPVNCAALSSTLAESEFFGHRRGSFTGADRERRGLFRAAHGGVLFLDEIGELPEALQAKLLRVLQDGTILTVGAEKEESVDVRVVAATNRDLAEQVRHGRFRSDLLHRLNVLQLHLPPLRERREDIVAIVDLVLSIQAAKLGKPCIKAAAEVIAAFQQMEFPGNVRQLENIVRRALGSLENSTILQLRDLPPAVWEEVAVAHADQPFTEPCPPPGTEGEWEVQVRPQFQKLIGLTRGQLHRSLQTCERLIISLVSEQTHGNQSEMARVLEVTPRSVYNKLRRHKLRDESF